MMIKTQKLKDKVKTCFYFLRNEKKFPSWTRKPVGNKQIPKQISFSFFRHTQIHVRTERYTHTQTHTHTYIYSSMARETRIQSQVESYQRLKKWYLIPHLLTLSIFSYGSRVKCSNPMNGVAPSPTPWYSSYWKGSLRVILDYGNHLLIYIYDWVLKSSLAYQ